MSNLGRVYPLSTLQNGSGIPSYGAFLGTAASAELIASINEQMGSTFFGTQFPDTTAAFMRDIVVPMQMQAQQIQMTAEILTNPDIIKPLIRAEDFLYVPPAMHEAIIMYAPVRDLLERGRISGFGFNPEYLPEEDVYQHILSSGRVEDISEAMDKDGMVKFRWSMHSDDPELNEDQVRSIRDTREAIDRMLAETEYDPTDWPNIRG